MSKDLLNPEDTYNMSPEALAVANNYLETNDVGDTARALSIPREKVTYYLNKREVKKYIDTIFLEQGYLNRGKLADAVTRIIEKKLEEFQRKNEDNLAIDGAGDLTYIAPTRVNLQLAEERYPDIAFRATREK